MANTSIKNAFERMWQHIVAKFDTVVYADEESVDTSIEVINADTLGGHLASDFAPAGDYATKDELNAINFPVDSVNGKTGIVQLSAEDVGAAPAVATSGVYAVSGEILISSGTARGCGNATIYILSDGFARIDFSAKVNVAGTDNTLFRVGIDASTFKLINANVPTITPVSYGTCIYYKADGTISTSLTGYGGRMAAADNRWVLGRIYTTAGEYGSWPDGQFGEGMYITGTCYGTVS